MGMVRAYCLTSLESTNETKLKPTYAISAYHH